MSSSLSWMVRTGGGALFMCLGTGFVLHAAVWMNANSQRPKETERISTTSFEVAPRPKPPERKKPKPKPKKKKRSRARSKAPPPRIPSSLAAAGFTPPGFEVAGVKTSEQKLLGHVKTNVMTQDSVDERPKPVRRVQPRISARMRATAKNGFVKLSVLVNERGAVERVKILESKPGRMYDQPALEAIKQWQFTPASYKGKPVKSWVTQKIAIRFS